MPCRLSLRRKYIATKGGNLGDFYKTLLVYASTSEEAILNLWSMLGDTPFYVTRKIVFIQKRANLKLQFVIL
jgi:hypothetical protein